jgi:hypothetical protein
LTFELRGSRERPISARDIGYEPTDNVRAARLGAQGWLVVERADQGRPLTVRIPEWCPVTVPAGPSPRILELWPVVDLGGERPPIGFDAPFSISVRHGCPERGRGRITWRQLEGVPLADLRASEDGFELSARTARFEVAHPEPPLGAGVVPLSPRTQGRALLEASWQGPDGRRIVRSVAMRASSRSSGLSSVAVTQQLLLAGAGWRVQHAPQAGHAQAHASGTFSLFTPDAHGRWTLGREDGQTLTLQALWHDKTPYDCGRSECHMGIAQTAVNNPMSHALERSLSGPVPAAVSCMLECHVLGEPGLADGGFVAVAAQLNWTWLDGARWQDLPQALRRLGGVRCTACHGPGAIPEPDAREHILSSDICASCHDAPPRYVHVQQWRNSRMARADAAVGTDASGCARCHTTAGFLARGSVAGRHSPRSSLGEGGTLGIACAACHSPHASHSAARLIREVDTPSWLADLGQLTPRDAVCVACHSPLPDEPWPSASSGALWLGRALIPSAAPAGWELVQSSAVHRGVPGGCVGCHGGGSAAESGKVDHSFRVDERVCGGCHANLDRVKATGEATRAIEQRALGLTRLLDQACGAAPPNSLSAPRHAKQASAVCHDQRLTRALYEVNLVLEDPAAAVHNPTFARELLDDAERQLSVRAFP